jgi:hypothetical protein
MSWQVGTGVEEMREGWKESRWCEKIYIESGMMMKGMVK